MADRGVIRPLRFFVTGGAGFTGSAVMRYLIADTPHQVLNLDKLTYAGNLANIASDLRYRFAQVDICDAPRVHETIADFRPHVIMHLAAESHVDRSIDGPAAFIETNVMDTFVLLEAAPAVLDDGDAKARFRFHHVSTDEVFGSLEESDVFHGDSPC